jgi:hypothetical protein
MWIYGFLSCLPPQYVRIVQKPQESERTNTEHYGEIERRFIDLKSIIQTLNIRPRNLGTLMRLGSLLDKEKAKQWLQRTQNHQKSL